MFKISPSLLSADPTKLRDQINILENAGADSLHIDMMDAIYVPSYAFSVTEVQFVIQSTELPLNVHVMMLEPERIASEVIALGASTVNIHYEASDDIIRVLDSVRSMGAKAGVVLNPETSTEVLTDDILHTADVVQLMSVVPGEPKKQAFINETLQRIRQVKSKISAIGSNALIQVDGDINYSNIYSVLESGANIVVVGAALFHGDLLENMTRFKGVLSGVHMEVGL